MEVTAPVELLLVEFPRSEFSGEIVAELVRLPQAGTTDVLDTLAVRKNEDGSVEWLEAADAVDGPAELAGEPRTAADDTLAQLQKLGEVRTAGLLTDAEFAAAKAKILG